MHAKRFKFKSALKINYQAQTIASQLDENIPRHHDYLLAVNTLTAYLLLMVQKPQEAIEFLHITERCLSKLVAGCCEEVDETKQGWAKQS